MGSSRASASAHCAVDRRMLMLCRVRLHSSNVPYCSLFIVQAFGAINAHACTWPQQCALPMFKKNRRNKASSWRTSPIAAKAMSKRRCGTVDVNAVKMDLHMQMVFVYWGIGGRTKCLHMNEIGKLDWKRPKHGQLGRRKCGCVYGEYTKDRITLPTWNVYWPYVEVMSN